MAARRFVIDTNLYIDAFRSDAGKAALTTFQGTFAPFIHLSAIVVHELRAGVRGKAAATLEASIVAPFERRSRVVTPSYAVWKEAGRVLSELVAPSDWRSLTRSFVNDVLLSMSCREAGMVLVTSNLRDFERIAAVREFAFVAPWPTPAG